MRDIPSSPVSQHKLTVEVKRQYPERDIAHGRYRDEDGNQFRGFRNLALAPDALDLSS